MDGSSPNLVLAFDTSNEVIAIGIGRLLPDTKSIELIYSTSLPAHRQSNTMLVPQIDEAFSALKIDKGEVCCVCVGRGPGSFTGVRIAMATAKGVASALHASLVGVSTQDAIAHDVSREGRKGRLLVASDAMRKEIYPAFYEIRDKVDRLNGDTVIKIDEFMDTSAEADIFMVTGDALGKYESRLSQLGEVLPENLWTVTGEGLLLALQDAWTRGEVDPFDAQTNDPVRLLPIYTRLSDAEEAERRKLSSPGKRNLITGVQGNKATGTITQDMAPEGSYDQSQISYRPFDVEFASAASDLEQACLSSDAWNADMIEDDLSRDDRTWWMAVENGELVGYAGARVTEDTAELLKIVVRQEQQRQGVGRRLLERVAYDAFNLASEKIMLEVRASNTHAQGFYKEAGFEEIGRRKGYYSDGEDALVFSRALPLEMDAAPESKALDFRACEPCRPLILAIESSCDETAASVIDGNGTILSDVVSSQIDFHARFGGVVPEIASRKHVEAIAGVARLALEDASGAIGKTLDFKGLDAIGVTYAPGLVGALVVGVAFAKGVAWASDVPLIAVNHLEGHLYANKLSMDGIDASGAIRFPAIVSLVSGGNTMLVLMRDWQDYEILGETIDDAVGEAFDKVAKAMGFPYPGGPQISRLAKEGDPDAIDFPRALMHSGDYRFSLSGLKTAVITYIADKRDKGEVLDLADICASFQQAVIDVQVEKARRAIVETGAKTFCLGGGVAANNELRGAYERMCASLGVETVMPPLSACGDNAAMIALVALDRFNQGKFASWDQDAYAHADLQEPY